MKKHSLVLILSFFFQPFALCSDFQFSLEAGELKVLTEGRKKLQTVKKFSIVDYCSNDDVILLGWNKLFTLDGGEVYDLRLQDNNGTITFFQYVRRTTTLIPTKQHNRITREELEKNYKRSRASSAQKFRCGNNCYTPQGNKFCHKREYYFNFHANITLCTDCYNMLLEGANQ